jgi:hypothetical protein
LGFGSLTYLLSVNPLGAVGSRSEAVKGSSVTGSGKGIQVLDGGRSREHFWLRLRHSPQANLQLA